MSKEQFITTDSYHTPEDHPRAFLDRLSLGTMMYFAPRFFNMLRGNRSLALAGKFDTQTWASRSMDIFRLVEDCGGKFHIEGLHNITSTKEPVIFVSNHMSMLESMIFPGLIAHMREVTFVVKKSLTTHKLFGPTMVARKPITVERKDPIADFKAVMAQGAENLENGTSVVIFPQSMRMVDFDPKQFNTLGIKLAKKTKTKIIPVALKTDYWANGKVVKDIGKLTRSKPIHIKFGEPFNIEGPGKKEHQQVIDFIQDSLKEWGH